MGASWDAYKAAWRVMRADPELFLMPFLGLVLFALLLPVAIGAWAGGIALVERFDSPSAVLFILILPYAWLLSTTFVLLDALVVVSAHERIHGGAPTLARSIGKVGRRLGPLLAWAFLTAFVYSLLALLSRKGSVGRVAAWAGGVAVSLATMFVVPHLVLEGGNVRGALRRSGERLFQQFGAVTGRTITFGFYGAIVFLGLVFGAPMLAGAVTTLLPDLPPGAFFAILLAPIVLAVLFACLHGVATSIYKTALYDAMRGKRAAWFPQDALVAPFD